MKFPPKYTLPVVVMQASNRPHSPLPSEAEPTPMRLSLEVIAVVTSFLTLVILFAIAADRLTGLLS